MELIAQLSKIERQFKMTKERKKKIMQMQSSKKERWNIIVTNAANEMLKNNITAKEQADFLKEYYDVYRMFIFGYGEKRFIQDVGKAMDKILRPDLYK